jgi:hypothetical protein
MMFGVAVTGSGVIDAEAHPLSKKSVKSKRRVFISSFYVFQKETPLP